MSHNLTSPQELRRQMEQEVRQNILPFWMNYAVDRKYGGFYGIVTNERQVDKRAPKALVIGARTLWTFAAAYRLFGENVYLDTARWAYDFLTGRFWDPLHSGLYWQVDYRGKPLTDRKQIYGQAFAIYGLAEYHRTAGHPQSLEQAIALFRLIERYSFDSQHGGYIEARQRDWQPLDDLRLSEKEPNIPKSMNTMLHVMESYTNLLRVWDSPELRQRQRALIENFLDHIVSHEAHPHLELFFDMQWNPAAAPISFGHDIEGSWLLVEAAEVLGDGVLAARCKAVSVELAQAVYEHGRDVDGSLFYEADARGIHNRDKHWWPQAEAVVGFYNAYQLTGRPYFLTASLQAWDYIQHQLVDRQYGEWFARRMADGALPPPGGEDVKVGPWKCPYHNSRACFELYERLSKGEGRGSEAA